MVRSREKKGCNITSSLSAESEACMPHPLPSLICPFGTGVNTRILSHNFTWTHFIKKLKGIFFSSIPLNYLAFITKKQCSGIRDIWVFWMKPVASLLLVGSFTYFANKMIFSHFMADIQKLIWKLIWNLHWSINLGWNAKHKRKWACFKHICFNSLVKKFFIDEKQWPIPRCATRGSKADLKVHQTVDWIE